MSAEFLRRAREKFSKTADRTLRAAVIASQLGLGAKLPTPSPKEFLSSPPGISTELRPEQTNQRTEEEKVTAEIRRIFELRDLGGVERKISPDSFAWLTTASRYLSLSVEQAMGLFRTAFEKRQPQCLAFRVFGEGQNKKISVLMKDFGVLEWNSELSAASFVELTPYQGSWFMSSIGELPRDTLENVQRNSTDLRPCPPRATESQEQRLLSEVSAIGLSAEFTRKGTILLLMPGDKLQEINLPSLQELNRGGMAFSPDGTKLVVWRDSRDKGKEGYELFLVSLQTGEFKPIFSDFVKNLGYLSRFIDLEWTQDSKKLRIASGHHGGGRGIVVDIDAEQVLFEYRGGIYGQFSPDGNWFARAEGKDLEVRRINDSYSFTIRNNGAGFSWSPDSRRLALHRCLAWDESSPWGPVCRDSKFSLYDLQKKELGVFAYSEAFVRPIFSPSGEKIFFRQRTNTKLTHFSVFNIRDGSSRLIDLTPVADTGIVFDGEWSWKFHTEDKILGYGKKYQDLRLYMLWIDATDGSLIARQWISYGMNDFASFLGLFEKHLLYSIDRGTRNRKVYIAPISDKNGPMEGIEVGSSPPMPDILVGGGKIHGVLGDGERFRASGQHFLFKDGKKYLIENEEAAEYFGGQKGSIPEGLAWFIPEGEKISFLPGDVIGHKDLGIWYLRNGKRFKIPNWQKFMDGQRFNRNAFILPPWLIQRIPEGEVTEPILGREGILDWNGGMKEFQPFGGRMIIFMGGYNGNTQSQQEAFQRIKEKLMERGWRENQFLEATYNIDIDAQRRLVLPKAYLAKDTKVYPPQSVSKLRLQLQRYKEIFPLTSFIIIGHSLGGFEGFEATLAHPDAVQAVITLDSPLKGVDRAFLVELPELLDQAVEMVGDEVMKYMNALGDDPARRQEQEAKAWQLYTRKVRVFTFSNDDDWFVRNGVAVLENSASEFEGQPVRLIWQLGHFSPHGIEDLASGHGQILQEESFLEELARILPAS